MKKQVSKAFLILLALAVVAGMGSCALFGGDTNLAIDWDGYEIFYSWDLPYPYDGPSWEYYTYYQVEPGTYYGIYALDMTGDGLVDTSDYWFELEIESKLFAERNYLLYCSSGGAWLFYDNNVPAPRILEPDGSWTSSITTEDGVITLKSKVITGPAPNPAPSSKSKTK